MGKILSEHIALTPIQAFLESESWGFYRGVSTEDNLNCCINADYAEGKDKVGGLLTEDALSADILMSMAFIEPKFISGLLEKCGWQEGTKRDKYEVVGVQSNFWYPRLTLQDLCDGKTEINKNDKSINYLRLAQPDGWIAGENLLVMIEAKGMRDGAAFNYAQLAKEYLIAKQECPGQPRILLLLTDEQKEKIDKKGGLVELFKKSWDELKVENPVSNKWSKTKVDFFKRDEVKKSLEEIKPDEKAINACFRILSYENLKDYATTYKTENESSQKLAAMIANTIAWHTPKEDRVEEIKYTDKNGKEKTKKITHYKPGTETPSIWSQMLMELANNQTPLYEFYTGGTINKIVTDAEDKFFENAGISEANSIRKAIKEVRDAVFKEKENIEKFYRLYCLQRALELPNEIKNLNKECEEWEKKQDKTDKEKKKEKDKKAKLASEELNLKYFTEKCCEENKKLEKTKSNNPLKDKFSELNANFHKNKSNLQWAKDKDQTGIVSSAVPNVRYLLYFYVRSLRGFDDAMPGYDYFGFDNKKFFVKK